MAVLHPTSEYVLTLAVPLMPAGGLFRITDHATASELRIAVYVTSAAAKARLIGRGGENINAIQHLAKERQHRDDPNLKVRIDVILAGGDR